MPSIRNYTSRAIRNASPFLVALFVIVLTGCRDAFVPTYPAAKQMDFSASRMKRFAVQKHDRRIPDEYIVVFDSDVQNPRALAAQLASISGGSLRHTYSSAISGFSAHMSQRAADAIAEHPGVAYVEQDQIVTTSEMSSFAQSWGLDRVDQAALPMDGYYKYNASGAGVNAYIIDTGIRLTHGQFGGRAFAGFTSINDGNGTNDCNWHGTHVAGTVGGANVGIARAVTLYAVRVLDCNGSGTVSGVIAGVDWVTANRRLPAVANMSLSGDYSDALNNAIQNSINSGVTYVVAAGNAASDACGYSPSSVSGALTVAASEASDAQASYSNFGPCVDLYAPGTAIWSAWSADDASLVKASGTSMASPHVAGAAALYLENNPAASPIEVVRAIIAASTTNAVIATGPNTPNQLLRVNGPATGVVLPPPPSAPPPANLAPFANFSANCPSQKSYCSFDGSTSTDDGRIVSYSWSFGDGTSLGSASNPMTSHTYRTKGSYTVTLTVVDDGGLSSAIQRSVVIKSVSKR